MNQIGRYEIKGELGRGGMATVFRGYDPRFKRDVAIKVLPREFLHDPTFRARFEREAQTIAALEHPAIVPVYDFGEDAEAGQPFIVMRLMTGGSLAERLARGPLSMAEAARLYARLASALDEAHARGIIHRDLKPGNILFDSRDDPYLSDFGIAKLTQASAAFTGSGVIGTPAYMSPEQAKGEKDIDGRSDVYALGAILFEMLTGQAPYEADTPMGVVVKHIVEPVPLILSVNPNLPRDCETIISRAMAKDRDARFQTASAMSDALTTTSQGRAMPVAASSAAAPPAAATPIAPAPTASRVMPPTAKPARAQAPTAAPRRTFPTWALAASGGVVLIGLVGLAIVGVLMSGVLNESATQTSAPATQVVVAQATVTTTKPAPTRVAPTATTRVEASATEAPPATATTAPQPTATLPPPTRTAPPPPSPTVAQGPSARITNITLNGSTYVIDYVTAGFTQALPGPHVHFFFNTVPPQQAGVPGGGPWKLYGGPSPFTGYTADERPANATQMCILVANPDHSVQQGTGNCVNLP